MQRQVNEQVLAGVASFKSKDAQAKMAEHLQAMQNCYAQPAPEPEQTREVPQRLTSIEYLSNDLHLSVSALEARVNPVLRPPCDETSCKSESIGPVQSITGDRLAQIQEALTSAIRRVRDLERRIEL